MGSDNSGKRTKSARLLVPIVAVIILVLGTIVFFIGESPNQVESGSDLARSFAKLEDALYKKPAAAFLRAPDAARMALNAGNRKGNSVIAAAVVEMKPVATVDYIIETFQKYLRAIHREFDKVVVGDNPEVTAEEVWEKFVELTNEYVIPLDTEFSPPSVDPSGETVFLSVATYRDENCPRTLTDAFQYAENPEGLWVGLVEQNCYANCRTGVLKDLSIRDAPPDVDCVKEFCDGEMGKYCDHLRVLRINESESLGPAMARYFGSKLYYGESYYMQIDSHMFFAEHWDTELKQMIKDAERPKAIITDYPPPDGWNWQKTIGLRMCDGFFTEPGIEEQIVRLEGSSQLDAERPKTPRFAPYIAAGFFFTIGDFILDVPFDPFMPWVFMGEEILLSSRAFSHGYHIFSPSINVLAHIYVRRNKPKFWETVGRAFKRPGFHNRLNKVVIRRVKHLLGYPECDDDLLWPPSLAIDTKTRYGMGKVRTLKQYMDMVGLDPVSKTNRRLEWCYKGETPPELLRYEAEEATALH